MPIYDPTPHPPTGPFSKRTLERSDAVEPVGTPHVFTDDFQPTIPWLDPTPEMLINDPVFDTIWNTIKTWDINVPEAYEGYCGATGAHARAIYDALETLCKHYNDREKDHV